MARIAHIDAGTCRGVLHPTPCYRVPTARLRLQVIVTRHADGAALLGSEDQARVIRINPGTTRPENMLFDMLACGFTSREA